MSAPLSFEQQRLWQLDQDLPGRTDYIVTWAWRFTGPLSTTAMHRALAALARRHDVLRTRIGSEHGTPVQIVVEELPVPLRVVDSGGRRLADWLAEELTRPFDLTTAPLWRVLAIRSGPAEHTLLFLWHHVLIDAWSSAILVRELSAFYTAEVTGTEARLPPLPARYAELARAQRDRPDDEDVAEQLDYWRGQLAGATPLRLPADRPRRVTTTPAGAGVGFTVPAAVTGRLAALARTERVTMFMVLLAATAAVLARHAGQPDVVVGTPLSDRDQVEAEPLIGCFLNMLVLRTDVSGEPAFTELLRRVRTTTLSGYEYGALPHARLRAELGLPDLLDVVFIVNNVEPVDWDLPGISAVDQPLPDGRARHELTVVFGQVAGELTGHVRYRADLFDRSRIEHLVTDLVDLLTAVAVDPALSPAGWR